MALRLPSRLSSASLPAAAMRSICPRFRAQLVSPPRRPARTCCERPGPWVGSASGVCVATFPTASRYGRCRGTVIAVMSKTQVWKRLRRSQPGVGEGRRYQGPGERPRAGSGRERASGRRRRASATACSTARSISSGGISRFWAQFFSMRAMRRSRAVSARRSTGPGLAPAGVIEPTSYHIVTVAVGPVIIHGGAGAAFRVGDDGSAPS